MSSESLPDARRPSPVVGSILIWIGLFLVTALIVMVMPLWALADEEKGETSSSEAVAPKPGLPLAGFSINGRFDLNYEQEKFSGSPADGTGTLRNYHHFLFVTRRKRDERFSFTAEVIDQSFYELGVRMGDNHGFRFGKILVPFGGDPPFHRTYGGLTGFDQKLVPILWAELGVAHRCAILKRPSYLIQNEIAIVSGIRATDPAKLRLNSAGDAGHPAIVDRIGYGREKYGAWLSVYFDRHSTNNNLIMWGGDLAAGYGFLPWSILRNLSAKIGFLRADVQNKPASWYYHFGDYLQLDYRLPRHFALRYRAGLTALDNPSGIFFDSSQEDENDRIGQNVGAWWHYELLSLGAEYFVNVERANEEANDLIRASAILEF